MFLLYNEQINQIRLIASKHFIETFQWNSFGTINRARFSPQKSENFNVIRCCLLVK